MSFRFVVGALLSVAFVALTGGPAFACKGAEVVFRDDFTEADPAWYVWWPDSSSFDIADGKVVAKSSPGTWAAMLYQGSYFPGGDACVDIVAPTGDNTWAGLDIHSDGVEYIPHITGDGKAGVTRLDKNGWLSPVPDRPFAAIKTEAGAVNNLRVVWSAPQPDNSQTPSDPTVQVFINDEPFIKFKIKPTDNRLLGFAIQTEGSETQFSNLIVTQ